MTSLAHVNLANKLQPFYTELSFLRIKVRSNLSYEPSPFSLIEKTEQGPGIPKREEQGGTFFRYSGLFVEEQPNLQTKNTARANMETRKQTSLACGIGPTKPQVQAKQPMVSKMNSSPNNRSIRTIRICGNLAWQQMPQNLCEIKNKQAVALH